MGFALRPEKRKGGWHSILTGLVLATAGTAPSLAETRVGAQAGVSLTRDANVARLLADHAPLGQIRPGGKFRVTPRAEFALGMMRAWNPRSWDHARLQQASLRLVLAFPLGAGADPFLEVGSGPVYLTDPRIGGWDLGLHWQFRSHIGVGTALSERVDLTYRYSHTSNANLGYPNPGINFHALLLSYRI
ncbi:MAG TPA: acyloxyacyl hydrolase [Gammaproteobacteria bacterium]|nr:acyloxyacyl hydrolase [Gammaproteobacteria bacterium]